VIFMKLSTRTRYGVRAMLELAVHYDKVPLQAKIIAQRQKISIKYLEQLLTMLKSGGFLRSIRGTKGGYTLTKPPNQIKLIEVFKALEGPVIIVECLEDGSHCAQVADCVARQLWAQVQEAIESVLESITLQDLLDKTKDKITLNYQI